MNVFPPPHCTCYKCDTNAVMEYLKPIPENNCIVEYNCNVLDKIESMDLIYGGYHDRKLILWTPKGSDFCVLIANTTTQFFGCARTLGRQKNILVTGYSAIDLSMGFEPFVDFYRLGGNLPNRYVRTMREYPRWEFYEEGEPLSFEYTDCYQKRLKRERLTSKMVVEYMQQSGYDVMDPSFYQASECIIVNNI